MNVNVRKTRNHMEAASGWRIRPRLLSLAGALGLLAVLVTMSPADGQFRRPRTVIGISGGLTSGDLAQPGSSTSSRSGWTAGLFYGMGTSRNSDLMLEANYVQKGGGQTQLDYVEVPFTFGLALPTDVGVRFRIYTGIGLGFRVGCEAVPPFHCDNAKSTEWTWPFGAAVGFWSRSVLVAGDVRYSVGLSDVFKTSLATNRSWQFRLYLGKTIG